MFETREYGLVELVAPATEPVSVDKAKDHLNQDHDEDDTRIGEMIEAAREWTEKFCGRAWITRTLKLTLDGFPRRLDNDWRRVTMDLRLPMAPLQSITSIEYVDLAGDQQTLASSKYVVDTTRLPGRVVPAYGEVWPCVRPGYPSSVLVTYEAGHGDAESDVPPLAREAMLDLVAYWYENREAVLVGTISTELQAHMKSKLWKLRVF